MGLSTDGCVRNVQFGLSAIPAASAAASAHFTETWESYATGTTPYGPWELEAGSWGTLARPDADGAGRYHSTPAGQTVWLRRAVDLSSLDHVVLQGWFCDSGNAGTRAFRPKGTSCGS